MENDDAAIGMLYRVYIHPKPKPRKQLFGDVRDILIANGLIVVYSRSAKPVFAGSIPARCSRMQWQDAVVSAVKK